MSGSWRARSNRTPVGAAIRGTVHPALRKEI